MTDTSTGHPAPHRDRVRSITLIFSAGAAPIFWLGQLMLAYAISAQVCFNGDHPTTVASSAPLHAVLLGFDVIAIAAAVAGGLVSYACWLRVRHEMAGGHRHMIEAGEGRTRFMAMWGMLSSGCFLFAIAFEAIASFMVPLCGR